jgi:hypothetical protein
VTVVPTVNGKRLGTLRTNLHEGSKVEAKRGTTLLLTRVQSQKDVQRKFKPFATEIGQVVAAWNELQEQLRTLFTLVVASRWGGDERHLVRNPQR